MRVRNYFVAAVTVGTVLLVTLTCFVHISAQSKDEFRWIDPQRDHALWAKVLLAFHDELKPDTPDPSTLTYGYKYLKQVGVVGNSALVVVGYKTREHPKVDEMGAEYFSAFNYDLASGSISKVVDPENNQLLMMWRWKLVKLARFEPSVAPDVVFTYMTCWECEPEKMLSALHYDSAARQWQVRRWGDGKPQWWMTPVGLVVGVDVYGGSDTVSYDCLYGLLDLNQGGFDSVAIRCKEVREPTKNKRQVNDATILYSLKQGHFTGEIVTEKNQRVNILSELCKVNSGNKLCKGVTKTNVAQSCAAQEPRTAHKTT